MREAGKYEVVGVAGGLEEKEKQDMQYSRVEKRVKRPIPIDVDMESNTSILVLSLFFLGRPLSFLPAVILLSNYERLRLEVKSR
jgi:hypothetical protein